MGEPVIAARDLIVPKPRSAPKPLSRDIVKLIASDIGKAVAHHIETMYPDAVKVTSRNMLISVRGSVTNEIMAALETIDEQEILQRLEARKQFRRKMKAAYKKIRDPLPAPASPPERTE